MPSKIKKPYVIYLAEVIYKDIAVIKKNNPDISNVDTSGTHLLGPHNLEFNLNVEKASQRTQRNTQTFDDLFDRLIENGFSVDYLPPRWTVLQPI